METTNAHEALDHWRVGFMGRVANSLFAEELFDRVPDIVFSVKDLRGRYVCMSEACAERCGLKSKAAAVGRTAHELFPQHMADRYARQDERVFRTGRALVDNLDLTLFNNRKPGWCLTSKVPLFGPTGEVMGLACLSRDVHEPGRAGLVDERFAETIDHIQANYGERLCIDSLARRAGMSAAQFERRMRRIFQLSTRQFIMKTRIDAAAERLWEDAQPIAAIALAVGFCDQSALSRQFKQVTGLSPRQYRQRGETRNGRGLAPGAKTPRNLVRVARRGDTGVSARARLSRRDGAAGATTSTSVLTARCASPSSFCIST